MSKLFSKCVNELDESIELIDDIVKSISIEPQKNKRSSTQIADFNYSLAESLIDKCNMVCEHYSKKDRPIIRIIHHFACSGGTLISKCIAAMANTFLLSEVHPNSNLYANVNTPQYLPSDISALCKFSSIPSQEILAMSLFSNSIKIVNEHVSARGGCLVLRDHTHADYCTSSNETFIPAVVGALTEKFNIISLITLRDPIDSYLSLVKNGWVHFSPKTFDQYCLRLLNFLKDYPDSGVVLYEEFVNEPKEVMKTICTVLDIEYNDMFEHIFYSFRVTGDSGRSGESISLRVRKELTSEFIDEIENSPNYDKFVVYIEKRLGMPKKRQNYCLSENLKIRNT